MVQGVTENNLIQTFTQRAQLPAYIIVPPLEERIVGLVRFINTTQFPVGVTALQDHNFAGGGRAVVTSASGAMEDLAYNINAAALTTLRIVPMDLQQEEGGAAFMEQNANQLVQDFQISYELALEFASQAFTIEQQD